MDPYAKQHIALEVTTAILLAGIALMSKMFKREDIKCCILLSAYTKSQLNKLMS